MVEESYYSVKPSEKKKHETKEWPILRQFIHHLVFQLLVKDDDVEGVVKIARKLDWDDPLVAKWMQKCILELGLNTTFSQLGRYAEFLLLMSKHRPVFTIRCIDALLEDIQVGLEKNDFRDAPRMVRLVKFLAEMYNYRLADSTIILDHLYHLIGFGGPSSYQASLPRTVYQILGSQGAMLRARGEGMAVIDEDTATEDRNLHQIGGTDSVGALGSFLRDIQAIPAGSPLLLRHASAPDDPLIDSFRIKLVCVLIDTCGHYFNGGALRAKFERFWLYFQRYKMTKLEMTLRIEYLIEDTFGKLTERFKTYTTLAEVDAAIIQTVTNEIETTIEKMFQMRGGGGGGEGGGGGGGGGGYHAYWGT
eukprot:GHVO01017752.1.p1 GENE.GHVO01017752.1~~GHVO01017752.1.p1  ORF type:complete len:363 (+),score=97.37 GHVO01017752.1:121-1209(+)